MATPRDRFNVAAAQIQNSPEVAGWPITVGIVGARCTSRGGFELAFTRPIPDNWKWPSNPDVPSDNFQYTVWMFVLINGLWHGAGFVQMWQGRGMGNRELPPIFADVDGVPGYRNWWGDPRHLWGSPLSEHEPIPGEPIGLMITAGNGRLTGGVTSVMERSNVVLFQIALDDSGSMVYLEDPPGPLDPPMIPLPPALPPDISARFDRLEALIEELRKVVLSKPAPDYTGSVQVPILGKGTVVLIPRKP